MEWRLTLGFPTHKRCELKANTVKIEYQDGTIAYWVGDIHCRSREEAVAELSRQFLELTAPTALEAKP